MDEKIASYLLASLHQRIHMGQVGAISDQEKEALWFAVQKLHPAGSAVPPALEVFPISDGAPKYAGKSQPDDAKQQSLPEISLDLRSLTFTEPPAKDVLLCLDFGTAMSKAFAIANDGAKYDLELGTSAGGNGYTLPSSIFIADDNKVYFGTMAIEQSQEFNPAGRERLDSIKSWLSLREGANIDGYVLGDAYCPASAELTEGDLIRIFLAYLTDVAGISLMKRGLIGDAVENFRYVKRRFARPCGKNATQAEWVDTLMRRLLAEAQVLADTFTGRWDVGIPMVELKSAINKVKALGQRPDYLIDVGVAEPVAVAAGAVEKSENRRDAYMVVDAGAGTTDFGLFFVMRNAQLKNPTVFQIEESIKGLNQAGDKVDQLLQTFIRAQESFDSTSGLGRLIEADLRRGIRVLKELLFSTGKAEYVLADSSIGTVFEKDFVNFPNVKQFAKRLEDGFREALEAVDESYLDYLAIEGVTLQVILTGGSAKLPMIKALGEGYVNVKGRMIKRVRVDAAPEWMENESEEMIEFYPQLAVAIGGASDELPRTDFAPEKLGRVAGATYVSSNLALSGA
jgi:molecular chaperone HscA